MIHFLLSALLCLPLTAGETHPSFTADVPVKVEATVPASSINDIKRTVAAANQYSPLEIMDEMDEVSDMQQFAKDRWQKRQKRYKKVAIPKSEEK